MIGTGGTAPSRSRSLLPDSRTLATRRSSCAMIRSHYGLPEGQDGIRSEMSSKLASHAGVHSLAFAPDGGTFRHSGGLTEQVLCDNDSPLAHSRFSSPGAQAHRRPEWATKKWRRMALFRGPKAPFSVLGAGAFEHKPLIGRLLCRATFWRPRARENVGRHFRARCFSTRQLCKGSILVSHSQSLQSSTSSYRRLP